jgi:hypothetical protein
MPRPWTTASRIERTSRLKKRIEAISLAKPRLIPKLLLRFSATNNNAEAQFRKERVLECYYHSDLRVIVCPFVQREYHPNLVQPKSQRLAMIQTTTWPPKFRGIGHT